MVNAIFHVLSYIGCVLMTIGTIFYTFLVHLLQIIFYGLLPTELFYHCNSWLVFNIWWCMNYILFHLSITSPSIEVIWEGFPQKINDGESAIVISNHVAASDFYIIHEVALRRGMLGRLRYFLKDSLKWIPIYGLGMYFLGMIYLKRSWDLDKDRINEQLKKYVEDSKNRLPVWIVMFVEGSRITLEKLRQSQDFCRQKKISPVPKHTLVPRSKGFCATIDACRKGSGIKYIYDVTIAYWHPTNGWGHAPSLSQVSFGCVPLNCRFYAHVKRISIDEVAIGQEDLWLKTQFLQKDAHLEKVKLAWEKNERNRVLS